MADDAVALAALVIPAGEERSLSAELFWVFRDVLSDHVWLGGRGEADLLKGRAGYDADLSVEAMKPAESGFDIGLKRLREAGDGQQERDDGEVANHWFSYASRPVYASGVMVLGKSNAAATNPKPFAFSVSR
jgi:hypothetical protein